jgi:biopolymer transport protein ExbD
LANWDVFHADRLELERALDPAAIRRAFECGELRDDDLVRPAGTTVAWSRLADMPELTVAAPAPVEPPRSAPASVAPLPAQQGAAVPTPLGDYEVESDDFGRESAATQATLRAPDFVELGAESDVTFPIINDQPPAAQSGSRAPNEREPDPQAEWLWAEEVDEDEEDENDFEEANEEPDHPAAGGLEILDDDSEVALPVGGTVEDAGFLSQNSRLALPVIESRGWDDIADATEEEEDEGVLSLSRSGPATVEELDLAPMVDVAFQLVLFFMVTATTVLYKTLEIPKPSSEQAPTAVAQGRSLEDLQNDNVLVEIDATGGVKIDREPVGRTMEAIVERLRTTREKTNRKSMLLSADHATKHRDTVLVIDAAAEIGMNIVIARPAAPQGPAPGTLTAPAAAKE